MCEIPNEVREMVDMMSGESNADPTQSGRSLMARKDDERWEALRQAAFDYVKAYDYWSSQHAPEVEDPDAQLAHAEVVLQAEAERYRRRSEMRKAGA